MNRHLLPVAALLVSALAMNLCGVRAANADILWPHKASARSDLLPVDQAFSLVSAERKRGTIEVSWSIAPGYYLYRSRLGFDPEPATAAHILASAKLPAGGHIRDERGDNEIYRDILVAVLPLRGAASVPKRLRVRYQGCADAGVCYPPQSKLIDVSSTAQP